MIKGDFVQGLSMMMSAMNASTSRDVVSSTMAHYLVAHGGSRFSASHKPKHLLLKQLEETLDGKAVNFTLRRTNKSKEDGTMYNGLIRLQMTTYIVQKSLNIYVLMNSQSYMRRNSTA